MLLGNQSGERFWVTDSLLLKAPSGRLLSKQGSYCFMGGYEQKTQIQTGHSQKINKGHKYISKTPILLLLDSMHKCKKP